jgi:hypothetical protein
MPIGAMLISLAGASLLSLPARAQDTYSWTFVNKTGDTEKFRTYIKLSGTSPDGATAITMTTKSASTHTYKDVSADGAATYDQLDDSSDTVINGMAIPDKPENHKPVTMVRGKDGVFVSRTATEPPSFARTSKCLVILMSLPVPDKPVKVGDSWTSTIPNALLKNKTLQVTSTLVGTEKVLGRDALKISLKMEFPSANFAADNEIVHMDETYYIDAKTHELLRARYTVKNAVLPFPTGKNESQAFVTRVIAGVNDKPDPDEEKMLGAEAGK